MLWVRTRVIIRFCLLGLLTGNTFGQTEVATYPQLPSAGWADHDRNCFPGDIPNFGATNDGPALLPQRCVHTGMDGTPSPGNIITVMPGESIQAAVNDASCGDTISITATIGDIQQAYAGFTLPAKACDRQHWITLQTDQIWQVPPEGTRITPCYAGVASLPGRPAYACPAGGPAVLVPQIQAQQTNTPAIMATPGADFYRIVGLEITPKPGVIQGNKLVVLSGGDHIILDRNWIHGSTSASDSNQGGVKVDGTYLAVIDSYLNDHKTDGSRFSESQAISGGNGPNLQGPAKIVNNFLEASTESFIFGGGAGTSAATIKDLVIQRNHAFKPFTWRMDCYSGIPSSQVYCGGQIYIGKKYVIKNLGELKNGDRVLVEGNVFENNWQGQADQPGYGFLMTPKNQQGGNPWAYVKNVTFRYNKIMNAAGGMGVSNACSHPGCSDSTIKNITWSAGVATVSLVDSIGYADPQTPQLQPGLKVDIVNVIPAGYNVRGAVVVAVDNDRQFTYRLPTNPGQYSRDGKAVNFSCGNAWSAGISNITIHDNVLDNINWTRFTVWDRTRGKWIVVAPNGRGVHSESHGYYLGAPETVKELSIDHNTFLTAGGTLGGSTSGGGFLFAGDITHKNYWSGLVITNNLNARNNKGLDKSKTIPRGWAAALSTLVPDGSWTFAKNVQPWGTFATQDLSDDPFPDTNQSCGINGESCEPMAPRCTAPTKQTCVGGWANVMFANFNNGGGGDYRLCQGPGEPVASCTGRSPFAGAGTDGKDIGADVNAVNAAISGVQ